jgi:hypothetical protein
MRRRTLYWSRIISAGKHRGQPGRTCCSGAQAVAGKRVSTSVEQLETQSYTIPVTQPSIALHASVRYPVPADNEAWLGSSAR